MLRPDQMAQVREDFCRWLSTPAPCGISHEHPYSPCLPEREDGRLLCLTCGLFQRRQLAPGGNP